MTGSMSATPTIAPSAAKARAIACPIPRPAPRDERNLTFETRHFFAPN